ncbi:hypothetical protein BS78_06G109400 [Paspalum vaginatum]|nr:hypothetical protein BS78_06G109400 [Paspalum vaginatum]
MDIPPTTTHHDGNEEDDDVLSYISRVLMEEDVVDGLLYQYPDHPTLLQTQHLFAQALSGTSSKALALRPCNSVEQSATQSSMEPASYRSSIVDTTAAAVQSVAHGSDFQDPAPAPASVNVGGIIQYRAYSTGAVEPNTMLPVESSSTFCKNVLSMAFLRGMEEANKFLPSDGGDTVGCRGIRKKRLDEADQAEAGAGRSNKQMAAGDVPQGLAEEADAARALLDRLILKGYEPSRADMQELRATVEMEKTARRRRGASAELVVDLHSMLIRCADAVATNDRHGAVDLLQRIRHHSSPAGDATQRLAHCFAEGLEARLAGTGSLLFRSLMAKSASAGVLEAYRVYMAACCFFPVSYLFSNKVIYNAVAGRKKLHIVNFGLSHGLQWPDLLRWLADREGGPPEVRLTGIDTPQPGFRPAKCIEEKGRRLSGCAHRFGVPFRFRGIAAAPEAFRADDLDIDPDEVLVVNSLFHFKTLMDDASVAVANGTNPTPMDVVLSTIAEMRPSVFIHGNVNASYSTAFFATRFREALYNFTALFDMMDTTMPRDSDKRMLFEREILARSAMSMIACEGKDREERPRSYKQWQASSQRAGLRQLPLDADVVKMLKDKVKKEYHKCFMIDEDHKWLLQGWKGRVLYALSTWTTTDDGLAGS